MNIVKPFKGVIYNKKKIKKLEKIIAPPYDVISKQMQDQLYLKSSFNIVRLIYGIDLPNDNKFENKYTRASQYFKQWLATEVLVQESSECFYICSQDYTLENSFTRWGFIGLYKLQNEKDNRILPHEKTYSAPKKDRFELIKNVKANLSSIFTLYKDDDNITEYIKSMCERWEPYIDAELDGVRNKVWKLRDKVSINNITDSMKKKQLYIADGHHRLEVAKKYQQYARKNSNASLNTNQPYDYTMMYFTSLNDSGLSILATHRLLNFKKFKECMVKVKEFFDVEEIDSLNSLKNKMKSNANKNCKSIGIFDGKKYYSAVIKNRVLTFSANDNIPKSIQELDVVILHKILFEKCLDISSNPEIHYTPSIDEAISKVKNKESDVAFLLNPVKMDELQKIVERGETFPQKTTFFYPKITSGLTLYKF